ncbi:MAG: M48 family metallopeptidase [Methanospirillaceae archaeon]|nr:M48 family metallopeptidase [Methanospirillaceae archaeon]
MTLIQVAEIAVEVDRKNIKNLHLGVYPPDGRVRVAAPTLVDDEAVRLAVISKLSWIRKQIVKYQSQERQSLREYVHNESHYYQGVRYLLSIVETEGKQEVSIKKSKEIILHIHKGATREGCEKLLNEWYRHQLKELIPPLIKKWESVLGVTVSWWGVRKMKTKWGSCNKEKGRILINLELIKKPSHCLDYIVLHEMLHLIEKRHNDRFRNLLTHHMPLWQMYRDELNECPLSHEKW